MFLIQQQTCKPNRHRTYQAFVERTKEEIREPQIKNKKCIPEKPGYDKQQATAGVTLFD